MICPVVQAMAEGGAAMGLPCRKRAAGTAAAVTFMSHSTAVTKNTYVLPRVPAAVAGGYRHSH